MRVTDDDRARVNAAIAAAESACPLEFVCVLSRAAGSYEFYPLAWSALLALATPWPLLHLTFWTVDQILLTQLIVFAVALLVLSFRPIRFHLVPRVVQRRAGHRAATEQFFVRGLARTPDRYGVLLFVAEEEHYARVLADDGAAALLADEDWRIAVDLLIAEARRGRHVEGFLAALDHCAGKGRAARPLQGERPNQLRDRFEVID